MGRDWPCAALWPPLAHSLREPALFRLSPAGRTPVSGVLHPDTSVTKNKTPVWVFDFLWRARILLLTFPYLNTQIQGIYREFCYFYPCLFDALTVANTGISRLLPPLAHKKAQNLTGNFIRHNREIYITNQDSICIYVP